MEQNPNSTPAIAIDRWCVEQLRFTAFLHPQSRDFSTSWKSLLGNEPDKTTITAAPPSRQDIGLFHSHQLILGTTPFRSDLLLLVNRSEDSLSPAETMFPKLRQMVDLFRPLAHKWANHVGVSPRLAVGVTALLPSASTDETYANLSTLLPRLNLNQRKCRDLSFRINVPIPSRSPVQTTINRLVEWSAINIQRVAFEANLFDQSQPSLETFPGRHFVRVTTDMNTHPLPDGAQISSHLDDLVDELFDESLAAIECGD